MEQALQLIAAGTEKEREAAAEALMAIGTAALPNLQRLLAERDTDPDARWWIARVLAALPGATSEALLLELLRDPDEDVRVCAVMGLGERRAAAAISPLLDLLAGAKNYLGLHLADALTKIGEPAVQGLIEALEHPNPSVRVLAARALVKIESKNAIPALIKALDDPEPAVEHYAWDALQRMGVGTILFFRP